MTSENSKSENITSISNTSSDAFLQLHPHVQKWIWNQKWDALREIQENAIAPIMSCDQDVIISAATAEGKTEAAFLPITSRLLSVDQIHRGFRVLYISPLKALINDQYDRFAGFWKPIDLPFYAWHGDIAQSKKMKAFRNPEGLLLITPESLEAILINHGQRVTSLFSSLEYIVIDELHAFIGSERGMQLQSLLHRVETTIKRRIPRIGLSATLGDMDLALKALRVNGEYPSTIIQSSSHSTTLQLKLLGFQNSDDANSEEKAEKSNRQSDEIVNSIYTNLRGESHLIFANSRSNVESYADMLRRRCEDDHVPNEYWPHHGNLSKALREDLEKALKSRSRPTTAVCTSTLELGIDIGQVSSVAQIGAPPSVSSLRQRLGRSGRRGQPPILREYICEPQIDARSRIGDCLHLQLVKAVAITNLMLRHWIEPPANARIHFSTLVQQILSLIAQHGSASIVSAWEILCRTGPFNNITKKDFKVFLKDLANSDLIQQMKNGELVLGGAGENLVGDYHFYAAFQTHTEYRIVHDGMTLGHLPIDFPLVVGLYPVRTIRAK